MKVNYTEIHSSAERKRRFLRGSVVISFVLILSEAGVLFWQNPSPRLLYVVVAVSCLLFSGLLVTGLFFWFASHQFAEEGE